MVIAVYYKDLSPDWYWLNSCILVLKEIDYLNFYRLFLNCDFQPEQEKKKQKKKRKKYRNSETVTMVSFKCSSALQMTPFIPQINGCQGLHPRVFFLKENNGFGERT